MFLLKSDNSPQTHYSTLKQPPFQRGDILKVTDIIYSYLYYVKKILSNVLIVFAYVILVYIQVAISMYTQYEYTGRWTGGVVAVGGILAFWTSYKACRWLRLKLDKTSFFNNQETEPISDKKISVVKVKDKNEIKENISSDSSKKSNFNPLIVLLLVIAIFLAVTTIINKNASEFDTVDDTIEKKIKSKPAVTNKSAKNLVRRVLSDSKPLKDGDQFREIKTTLSNIIKEFPNHPDAYAVLGYIQSRMSYDKSGYADAVFNLTKAINLGYKYSYDLYYWRGNAKFELGDKIGQKKDFQKSIDTLKKIQNSPKKSAWVEFKIGLSYVYLNDGSEADYLNSLKHFRKALEIFEKEKRVGYVEIDRSLVSKTITPEIIPFSKFSRREGDLNQDIYRGIGMSYDFNLHRRDPYDYYEGIPSNINKSTKNDFCNLMSKAGEEGYSKAYEYIKECCNRR